MPITTAQNTPREAAQKVLEILKNLFQEVLKPSETPGRRGHSHTSPAITRGAKKGREATRFPAFFVVWSAGYNMVMKLTNRVTFRACMIQKRARVRKARPLRRRGDSLRPRNSQMKQQTAPMQTRAVQT